ncbi:MAG: hypothetical protein AAF703_13680 [Cyanobacteria bacterium P01_D01_bin.105]
MHEHVAIPDYPNVVWAFDYRGLNIEITTGTHHGQTIYSAWVTHANGSAVAVPFAQTREAAITLAKRWVRSHFD